MIENIGKDLAQKAYLGVEELKKEINLKEKSLAIKDNYFYDNIEDFCSNEVLKAYYYESEDNSVSDINFNCELQNSSSVTIKFVLNNQIVFKKSYNNITKFCEKFCVINDNSNTLKIYVIGATEVWFDFNLELEGKLDKLKAKKNFMDISSSGSVSYVKNIGNKFKLLTYSSIENLKNDISIGSSTFFNNVLDAKYIKYLISDNYFENFYVLTKSDDSTALNLYSSSDNYVCHQIYSGEPSFACIIQLKHIYCPYLIGLIDNGVIKILYFDASFNLLQTTVLSTNILTKIVEFGCCYSQYASYENAVFYVKDTFNNYYLCGDINYSFYSTQLDINSEYVFIGTGDDIKINLYNGTSLTVYISSKLNCVQKINLDIVSINGKNYFKKNSNQNFKNVNEIFLLNTSEIKFHKEILCV